MMRRIMLVALTLLLALSVIGWIVYIPPSALRRLSPVPAHAQIVYQSVTPDWFLSFFPTLGKSGDDVSNDWKNSIPQRSWFQGLEKSPLTVATVSLGGRDRRNTWVAVSALGPCALGIQWQLKFFPSAGIKPLRSYGAWPVWQYSDASLPAWARIRFSIAEGLLICSISEDSHDLEYLLDTLDGRRPSAERKRN
jgi:hypothetical protein